MDSNKTDPLYFEPNPNRQFAEIVGGIILLPAGILVAAQSAVHVPKPILFFELLGLSAMVLGITLLNVAWVRGRRLAWGDLLQLRGGPFLLLAVAARYMWLIIRCLFGSR